MPIVLVNMNPSVFQLLHLLISEVQVNVFQVLLESRLNRKRFNLK